MFKKIIVASSLSLACFSAFAVTAQSGIYVGAAGGWSFADAPTSSEINDIGVTENNSTSNKNYTWGGTLGYDYAFNQNWLAGVEVSYFDFGKNEYSGNLLGSPYHFDLRSTGVQAMLTGTYLNPNGWNVFAKAGAIDEDTDIEDVSLGGTDVNADDAKSWIPAAALGIGYMPTQNLNIALQYEYTFGDNWSDRSTFTHGDEPDPITQGALTLGITYKFPLSDQTI